MASLDERVILIEDTRELQCAAPDCVALRTRPGSRHAWPISSARRCACVPTASSSARCAAREALDMLKAWNTGHPGGIATVHANSRARPRSTGSSSSSRKRVVTVPRRLIAEAIDLIVFIAGRGTARRDRDDRRVTGLDADGDYAVTDLTPDRSTPSDRRIDHVATFQLPVRADRLLSLGAAHARRRARSGRHRAGRRLRHAVGSSRSSRSWNSVQGPVAKIVAVIIIIITGLTLAFGETAGGFRRLIQIVFGLSIAFAASSFFLSFFSFGGGALIA